MCDKTKITEEMNIHKVWYQRAKEMEYKDLSAFIDELVSNYKHDYGTICHAIAAGAIATAYAMNRTPTGGITGFQASCIMWEFIKEWAGKKPPLKLVEYEQMLYPQYEEKFQKTISKETFQYLQNKAKERINENGEAHEAVKAHWQSIIDGNIPFGYQITETS